MKTKDAVIIGGLGLGAYLLWRNVPSVTTPTEATQRFATNAFWDTGFGDITLSAMDWYTNGWGEWGDGWDWTYSGDAATDLQRRFENGSYSTL